MTKVILICAALAVAQAQPRVTRVIDVAKVWAGHPVGFDLLTVDDRQFIAFYDAERRMTVGVRKLDSDRWHFARLPSQLGWDSHNSIVMAVDQDGYVHLSGNMHVHPLVYFRTQKPYDIDTFEGVHKMVGMEEARCTYPHFFRGTSDELIFTYRDGRSGSGNQIYNVYDAKKREWRRLLDKPLTDGQGRMNAYLHGPLRGPDGYFHLLWVWRNTPDCSTNHDLSYARSKDLVRWETSGGKPLELPVRVETGEIIDPVPVEGGIINGCQRIGWDSLKRAIVTYHKFDERGKTQVYAARLESGRWMIYRISDWDYRWEFRGGGSIQAEIRLGEVKPDGSGNLVLEYDHVKYGKGRWRLDERTLRTRETLPPAPVWPRELEKVESQFPGMEVRLRAAAGTGGMTYVLRWETLPPNRDRKREGPLPEASMLRLYEVTGSLAPRPPGPR